MAVAILADDLTGACDAAAPFAARGFETAVALDPLRAAGAFVQAWDMDCRDRADGVTQAVRQLAAAVAERAILLKIDSTLRGPIPEMVEGVVGGSGRRLALVAPAFPEQGRALVRGRLVVDGVVDAGAPVLADALARVVARVVSVPEPCPDASALVALATSGVDPALDAGPQVTAIVIDADGPSALVRTAGAWLQDPAQVVLVGSSGVARRAAASLSGPIGARRLRSLGTGPIVMVAASPSASTQRQLDRLERLDAGAGALAVFRSGPMDSGGDRDLGQASAGAVDRFAGWLEGGTWPRLVVLVGGRTARLACERLGASTLALGGELAPGIPYGRFGDGALDDVPVITKAGGFGGDDALVAIVEAAADETCWLWNEPQEA